VVCQPPCFAGFGLLIRRGGRSGQVDGGLHRVVSNSGCSAAAGFWGAVGVPASRVEKNKRRLTPRRIARTIAGRFLSDLMKAYLTQEYTRLAAVCGGHFVSVSVLSSGKPRCHHPTRVLSPRQLPTDHDMRIRPAAIRVLNCRVCLLSCYRLYRLLICLGRIGKDPH